MIYIEEVAHVIMIFLSIHLASITLALFIAKIIKSLLFVHPKETRRRVFYERLALYAYH
jgi:hypothetical protein